MKHFLKMADLSCDEIISILDLADELKDKKRRKSLTNICRISPSG